MAADNQGSEPVDTEDVPSDFFDDFNKDEFMDGLSVIDSWGEGDKRSARIDATAVESVKDLRELIDDDKKRERTTKIKDDDKYKKEYEYYETVRKKLASPTSISDYVKPGSRRDPNKTNEAIKKDKEVKVKEYLEKCLGGNEDIRPPGTELDDFFSEKKVTEKKRPLPEEFRPHHSRDKPRWEVPYKRHAPHWSPKHTLRVSPRRSPHRSPRTSVRHSPHHSPRRSPNRFNMRKFSPFRKPNRRHYSPERRSPRRYSPGGHSFERHSPGYSLGRHSPGRHNPGRHSPGRHNSGRHSPARRSPGRRSPGRRSPKWSLRSRSPLPYRSPYSGRRSHSMSPLNRDSFLYPAESLASQYPESQGQFTYPNIPVSEYATAMGQVYQQPVYYSGGYSGTGYDYGGQMGGVPAPQPVPAPVLNSVPAPPLNQAVPSGNPATTPAMVPPPQPMSVSGTADPPSQAMNVVTPYDALAQLVADGKLSKEDYLKLAPHKGVSHGVDVKTRVAVLNRCNQVFSRLSNMNLPNRLVMDSNLTNVQEIKSLAPKFCSPLKRQATVEFHFTKASGSSITLQNKQLIDSVFAAIGLDKVASKPKKKPHKDMKDVAVQTTKMFCDVCEIRESMQFNEMSTSIEHEHFSVSTHTQVVDQDLINSKAVFNPSGSVSDVAPISIAHLTPAQLVSQLAARAKTLKQSPDSMPLPNSYSRRPPNNYDYDGRGGGHQYQNNYNYRY